MDTVDGHPDVYIRGRRGVVGTFRYQPEDQKHMKRLCLEKKVYLYT